jgi:2-keto-4-pentenoate hydratase
MLRSNQLSYTTENQMLQNQKFFSQRLASSSQKLYTRFGHAPKSANNLTMNSPDTLHPLHAHPAEEAARVIWSHWQSGQVLNALPEACCPLTTEQGYAAQAQLPAVSGRTVVGWKIAATSANGQAHIHVGGPLAGRLLSGQVLDSGAAVPSQGNRMRVAEPEFAFAMGQDLPPQSEPYTQQQVMAAVAALHPAIEVPDSRLEPFTAAGVVGQQLRFACARHFVLGPASPDLWRTVDLSTYPVQARVDQGERSRYTREGNGGNVLGDPRIALTWLANQLSRLGITLQKGQVVTTGTCMVPLELEPGDTATADYGPLGRVRMTFAK